MYNYILILYHIFDKFTTIFIIKSRLLISYFTCYNITYIMSYFLDVWKQGVIMLERINKTNDIKNLNHEEKVMLASELRDYIIDVVSKNGGHLASNLGVVELTIALESVFDVSKDKIIWDVGHQCYVHKILNGRREELKNIRKMNGISGFPKICESETDCFNTGHSSTSISAAMGMGGGYVPMITQESERCSVSIGNGQLHDALSPSEEVSKTLNCLEDPGKIIETQYDNLVVRRLTPLECSRLQGLPDGWLDIGDWVDENRKKHKDSDSPKYKMAGNGIALPFWEWLMIRIGEQLRKDGVENPTMASLFAGSGSFELIAKRNGIEPKWNSEIEPYAVALLKQRFGDGENPGDIEKFL